MSETNDLPISKLACLSVLISDAYSLVEGHINIRNIYRAIEELEQVVMDIADAEAQEISMFIQVYEQLAKLFMQEKYQEFIEYWKANVPKLQSWEQLSLKRELVGKWQHKEIIKALLVD